MRDRRALSVSIVRLVASLSTTLILIALVALGAIKLSSEELEAFRRDVTIPMDMVYELNGSLSRSQASTVIAATSASTYWQYNADLERREVASQLHGLRDATTRIRSLDIRLSVVDAALRQWLAAAESAALGDRTVQSLTDVEYAEARVQLELLALDLAQIRQQGRADLDRQTIRGALVVGLATLVGLGLIIWLGRRSVVRLTSPLRELQDAVEARLAGDTTVRAPEDQGFREAGLLASVLNQTYDANDSLMDQQDRAITAHQLTDRVTHELAEMNAGSAGWRRALETIVSSFQLAGIEVWDTVGDEEPRMVQRFPDDPGTATGGGAVVPLELSGQAQGHLVIHSPHGLSDQHRRALALMGNPLAAALALGSLMRRAERLDQDKTDFLASTSHELRTPLTSMVAWLDMMEDGELGALQPEQARAVTVVQRNARRLLGLIEDLLMVNRLESGRARLSHEAISICQLTRGVLESLQPTAAEKGVALTMADEVPTQPECVVVGDRSHAERALTNVVGNAVKFTPTGGTVRVTASLDADEVVVCCRDDGIGIPPEDQTHVLGRFHRASNAASTPGTGLGLAIVSSIMEAHGGRLELTSAVGAGTEVCLHFPRSHAGATAS